ncbi:hypothetical protein L6452_21572 [Arctium lappa]|uniref:Uncharacterized protein n=1 Tax=Arctium lappa TaxID=4217 RepID=A0ACB9AWH8_ARCLA|nr:hypothetical protein L6452_21572 [Arctium lappa]
MKNMPQESLRSVVYRSFVTCEDPRGVIEGKTIKISKTDATKMGSQKHETQSKNPKEKEKMSSYQLVEVKNGAQKLNRAIDSWSNGGSFRGQPKDIAKDLLKGALDLQESLVMLGKLQEVSCMASSKKKQPDKPEVLVGRIGSDRFESFRNYDTGFRDQRDLENGSSRDCYAELREVIRDGLSRQNLLPRNQENCFGGKKKLQLSPDIASTSSSRSSSMVYSTHEFTSSDQSFSSRATEERSKGSNLIAKLMGLEEFPSKTVLSSPGKPSYSSRTRPVFDIDLPNGKKPEFSGRKSDREQVSLDKIIEMMQSKGLLRSKNREIKQTSDSNSNSYSEKRSRDNAPPIVLMKPQRLGPDKVVNNQKSKANVNPIRKLHQEKAKAEEKAIKISGKSASNKQKASVVRKPERKQEIEKKIDKIQKMAPPPVRRKPVINSVSKSGSSKQAKSVVVVQNPVTKRTSSSGLSNSSNQKKNSKIEKAVNEVLPTTIIHEVLQIDSTNVEEIEIEDSEVTIKEIDNERQKSIREASEEDPHHVNDPVSSTEHSETRNNREKSSVSDIQEQKTRILQNVTSFQDSEPASLDLLHDCVNEFFDHENHRHSNPFHQTSVLKSRVCISEDQLTREIVNGVKNLRNYSEISNENSNADTVSGLLERDLTWNSMGVGVWNSGWKDGCTLDEVEEVILDLEKILLSRLIDDMLKELVP